MKLASSKSLEYIQKGKFERIYRVRTRVDVYSFYLHKIIR